MRQGRVELPLVDHGEPVDAWMNEEALESRHARGCQTFNVLLVVAHYSAPRHPVHMALTLRGPAFRFERGHGRRRRQTIERHVHKQRVTTGRSCAGRRAESFPFGSPGFADVDVRIHQPWQNGSLAKVRYGNMRGQLMWWNDIKDSSIFDEHRRRF